jgi:pimeloyl-ACP methyl ester carboxylesterase
VESSEPIVARGLPACRRWLGRITALALATTLAACRSPQGVNSIGAKQVLPQLQSSAINSDEPSAATRQTLTMLGLQSAWETDPDHTLTQLRALAVQNHDRNLYFTLAELHYVRARETGDHGHDFAAVLCAYWFLMSKYMPVPPDPFDRRFRQACDLYNLCLLRALHGLGEEVDLEPGVVRIPGGKLDIRTDRTAFPFGEDVIDSFVSADDLEVRGFDVRNRDFGLGLPLVGHGTNKDPSSPARRYLPERLNVPGTAFLRVLDEPDAWDNGGQLRATLELYSAFDAPSVQVNGERVPLETDVTASLAYALEGAPVWDFELASFMGGESGVKTGLFMMQPYVPGRIPVVLVHGTASSPARWAPMFNGLLADPVLRSRCQFWFFIYSTSSPIAISGKLLRDALTQVGPNLDPQGRDPALSQMVLIGHSQGGLLSRMMVTTSGDAVWNSISPEVPLTDFDLTPETRALVQSALWWSRVPNVNRVIFIATPQRGSFRTTGWIGSIVNMFIGLPQKVGNTMSDLVNKNREKLPPALRDQIPTAVANMQPTNPFLLGLSSLPIDPAVSYHSIIAVSDLQAPAESDDGIVEYSSAHLEGAESEFLVESFHSCQANPLVIREVRRILLEQVAAFDAARGDGAAPPAAGPSR